MGIEGFAEAALSIAPGWEVEAVEDVEFLAPFKFYRGEPRTVTIEARFHPEGDRLVADCRLTGRRVLANQAEARVETHFTGRVRLAKERPAMVGGPAPGEPRGSVIDAEDIYRVYFHGPAYRVLKRAWWDENGAVGEMAAGLPANHYPSDQPLADRAAVDRTLLPDGRHLGDGCTPSYGPAAAYRSGFVLSRAGGPRPVRCLPSSLPDAAAGSFDAAVIDRAGARYLHDERLPNGTFRGGRGCAACSR